MASLPRRSARLANRLPEPPSSDLERVDVILAIADYCKEKNLAFSNNLLDEFDEWSHKNSWPYIKYYPLSRVARWWASDYSTSLEKQKRMNKYYDALVRTCNRRLIPFTQKIYDDFVLWYDTPANNSSIIVLRHYGRDRTYEVYQQPAILAKVFLYYYTK
jgi:hypothetical protein